MKIVRWYALVLVLISFAIAAQDDVAYRSQPAYLVEVLKKLKSGENVTFAKFGDGEYLCMSQEYLRTGGEAHNCDGDQYHPWLSAALKNAFVSLCKKPNTYIGRWHTINSGAKPAAIDAYYIGCARAHGAEIPFVSYHLIMNDDSFLCYPYMHELVEFLVNTKRKKIVMGNAHNRPLKELFRADVYVEIPPRSWSLEYDTWKDIVMSHLEPDAILLTAGGLCSKVLINEVTNHYDMTCLDIGSAFDIIGGNCFSRSPRYHTYQDELNYYHDLLPKGYHVQRGSSSRGVSPE